MKEQLMPVETRFGRSVQPSGADTLAALIPELVVALEAGGAPVKGFFEPGVSRNIVERALAPLGLTAPDELVTWFSWQNGQTPTRQPSVLPFSIPQSIEWVAGNYAYYQRNEILPEGRWAWSPGWLCLDGDAHGLNMWCGDDPKQPPRIRRPDEENRPLDAHNNVGQIVSLCTVVAWWIEAIESGALYWTNHWNSTYLKLPEAGRR